MATRTIIMCDICKQELALEQPYTFISIKRGSVQISNNQPYESKKQIENICDRCIEQGILIAANLQTTTYTAKLKE